jgi:hypothetical protein
MSDPVMMYGARFPKPWRTPVERPRNPAETITPEGIREIVREELRAPGFAPSTSDCAACGNTGPTVKKGLVAICRKCAVEALRAIERVGR